jgi:hypothetical protein
MAGETFVVCAGGVINPDALHSTCSRGVVDRNLIFWPQI